MVRLRAEDSSLHRMTAARFFSGSRVRKSVQPKPIAAVADGFDPLEVPQSPAQAACS